MGRRHLMYRGNATGLGIKDQVLCPREIPNQVSRDKWPKQPIRYCDLRNIVLAALFCLIAASRADSAELTVVPGDGLDSHPGLRDAIIRYYSLERERDWLSLYEMRPTSYWDVVPFESYRIAMQRDAKRGSLFSIEIKFADMEAPKLLLSSPKPDLVRVIIRFVDNVKAAGTVIGKGYGDPDELRPVDNTEATFWLMESGVWKCFICADRGYLTLNGQVTF